MKPTTRNTVTRLAVLLTITISILGVTMGLASSERTGLTDQRLRADSPQRARGGSPKPANPTSLITQDLAGGLTLEDIIAALVGSSSIAISNVEFSGSDSALGTFVGGTGIIGFEQGIVLSSGMVTNVVGPNTEDGSGYGHDLPGDPDLDSLIPGFQTEDACILEFDFECPAVKEIGFEYVFSSEEYNEFVYNSYNDVFGFFVNGENIALLPDGETVVSIDNVNGGNPLGDSAANPQYYINNDECQFSTVPSCPVNTEMDGLTVVLIARAKIQPGINHIKLAIADAGDDIYDSDVFLKGQSFVCGAVNNSAPTCSIDPPGPFSLDVGGNLTFTVTGTDPDDGQSIYLYTLGNLPPGAVMTPSLPRAGSRTGLSSQFSWTPTQSGVYSAGFFVTDSLGGADTVSTQITVTLPDVNNPPVCEFNPLGPFIVNVGANLSFSVVGTDPDIDQTIYLHQSGPWPGGASMVPPLPLAGPGAGITSQFSWTPTQSGVYSVGFLVTDSLGGADTSSVQITVTSPEINTPPVCVITPPGPFTIRAGWTLLFAVSGNDPDTGQLLTLTAFGPLPAGVSMNPPLPTAGPSGFLSQFSWAPPQPGSFFVGFQLEDNLGAKDTITTSITVLENTAPYVVSVSPSNGMTDVPWGARIRIEFSEPLNYRCDLLNPPIICLTVSSQRVGVPSIAYTWDGRFLETTPNLLWPDDDTITVVVSGELPDLAGNRLDGDSDGVSEGSPDDDYTLWFSTAPGVFPGDANDDGIVDERDVLPLGVHYLRTGPARIKNSDIWTLEFARPWIPFEATHADCDGNGVIDSTDVCPILEFFDREIPAKLSPAFPMIGALSTLDADIRASLARALVDCESGSPAARVALLNALTGHSDIQTTPPQSFQLDQNFPNPFNAGTSIGWEIDRTTIVELVVFDILGRRIRTLSDTEYPAGSHIVQWDGRNEDGKEVASGIYCYRLRAGTQSTSRTMVLIR